MSNIKTLRTVFAFLLACTLCAELQPAAHAQITIYESDLRTLVGGVFHNQQFRATSPGALEVIFNQSGSEQTYDFRPYAYETGFPSVLNRRTLDASTMPEVPLGGQFEARGANVVSELRSPASLDPSGSPSDSTVWAFERIDSDTTAFYGLVNITNTDLDQDGNTPDTLNITFDPLRFDGPVPNTFGTSWTQSYEQRTLVNGVSTGTVSSFSEMSEVIGYGTLHTPVGSAEVLQIETVSNQTVVGTTTQTTSMEFISKDGRLTAIIAYNNQTGQVTSASYTVFADDQSTTDIAAGATPSFQAFGVEVNLTQNSTGEEAQLSTFRYESAPINRSFSGSATSDDGTQVTPNTVWKEEYYVVEATGLTSFVSDVCLETSGVPGVDNRQRLVVLKRPDASQPWTPVPSSLDGTQLCASGLSSFSQFAIGADAAENPLPVELAHFDATVDDGDALLQWTTASETNNAGFSVQHRGPQARQWTESAFVEGAGTTGQAHDYRYRVSELNPGLHRFRLHQVDHDGTATLSDEVRVRIVPASTVAIGQNPVRVEAAATLTLSEAQTVRVEAFDVLGRKVRTVHDGPLTRGSHTFRFDVRNLRSGRYFLRVKGASFATTQSFVVVH